MRVLVVEDDTDLAVAIAAGLHSDGYDVDVAADGPSGLWQAAEGSYVAIVLDLLLPGMSGFAVCAELRRRQVWTPVLVLTAKDGEWDEVEALDSGADDYLTKPFSFAVLLARLRVLRRRPDGARPAVLRCGGIEIDPARRQVTRDGHLVPLTPREFAVLEHLARHVGRVVPKHELLDAVWGWERDRSPAVAEVYVGYLRRKLDAPFGGSALQTVRGVGYELIDDRG